MSHIVTIRTQIRDPAALLAACARIGLAPPVDGTTRLYTTDATGHRVQLPGWTYPVVVHLETGQLEFDNYGGAWGEQAQLDRLLQAYAVEKAKIEARKAGHGVVEQLLPDGSIKLTLQVRGGDA